MIADLTTETMPRCASCTHWNQDVPTYCKPWYRHQTGYGLCTAIQWGHASKDAPAFLSRGSDLITSGNEFGCTFHESKENPDAPAH